MVSIRTVSRDAVHRRAVARLGEDAELHWSEWRADPAVSELLGIVGDRVGVLRDGLTDAVARFRASGDPVAGLSCIYLLQAAVIASVEERQDLGTATDTTENVRGAPAGLCEGPRE